MFRIWVVNHHHHPPPPSPTILSKSYKSVPFLHFIIHQVCCGHNPFFKLPAPHFHLISEESRNTHTCIIHHDYYCLFIRVEVGNPQGQYPQVLTCTYPSNDVRYECLSLDCMKFITSLELGKKQTKPLKWQRGKAFIFWCTVLVVTLNVLFFCFWCFFFFFFFFLLKCDWGFLTRMVYLDHDI